jgi:hypothetical protein
MAVFKPMPQMSVDELKARAEFHASTAAMFKDRREFSEARRFQELSDQYAEELGRRTQ